MFDEDLYYCLVLHKTILHVTFSSACIVKNTTRRRTRSTQPTTPPILNKSRWTRRISAMYGTIFTQFMSFVFLYFVHVAWWSRSVYSIHATFFCSLLIVVVLQREILQHQRTTDLYAHYTRADALLPRQWDHQRRKKDKEIKSDSYSHTLTWNLCARNKTVVFVF